MHVRTSAHWTSDKYHIHVGLKTYEMCLLKSIFDQCTLILNWNTTALLIETSYPSLSWPRFSPALGTARPSAGPPLHTLGRAPPGAANRQGPRAPGPSAAGSCDPQVTGVTGGERLQRQQGEFISANNLAVAIRMLWRLVMLRTLLLLVLGGHNLSCLAVRVMLNQSKIYCRNWGGVDSILLVL
jgi:hypothetical protein